MYVAAAQQHGTEASVCPLQEMPQPPRDSSPGIRTMQKLFLAMAAHSSFHRDSGIQKRLSSHSLHFSLHLSNLTAPNVTLSKLCYVLLFPKDATESFLLAHVKQNSLFFQKCTWVCGRVPPFMHLLPGLHAMMELQTVLQDSHRTHCHTLALTPPIFQHSLPFDHLPLHLPLTHTHTHTLSIHSKKQLSFVTLASDTITCTGQNQTC